MRSSNVAGRRLALAVTFAAARPAAAWTPPADLPDTRPYDGPASTPDASHATPPVTPPPPPPATSEPAAPPPVAAPLRARFVVANTYGFNLGLAPKGPSGEVSLFLGGSVPRPMRRAGHWLALGLETTISFGGVDQAGLLEDGYPLAFRHHLTAHGVAGEAGRLMYAAGVGPIYFTVGYFGVEGEGRLGYTFTQRPGARLKGIIGAQLRVVGMIDQGPVTQPRPQLGIFVGFTRSPDGPHPARGARPRRPAPDPANEPPWGVGCLIPGVLLLVGAVVLVAVDLGASRDPNSEPAGPTLALVGGPVLGAAGIPLTTVGAVRLHRYHRWKQRVTVGPTTTLHF